MLEGSKFCNKCDIKIINNIKQKQNSNTKCVVFGYCISLFILSQKRNSKIYIIKNKKEVLLKSLPYSLISLLFGWWGIPWGPIWTISTIVDNFCGGKDVTEVVQDYLNNKNIN